MKKIEAKKDENVKVYYINRTKGKVGSFIPTFINRTPQENGSDKVDITFTANKRDAKDKFDFYFLESEWLEEVKKLYPPTECITNLKIN